MTKNRTAIDYATEGDLVQALSPSSSCPSPEDETTKTTAASYHYSSSPANPNEPLELEKTQQWDWTIENALDDYDIQSVSREVQRLLTLKSYMALEFQGMELGSPTRSTFHQLGCLAKVACNGAAGLITLVDLGRQWFLANSENLEEPGETPRKNGFCAHAILCKERTFVVKDATKDDRFVDHFLVTDHGLRFYAGVPLITPEGYKIGALCITDGKPRPQGLTTAEEEQLHLLGKLAVNALVNHRTMCEQRCQLERTARKSAVAAHNLVTPLTGAQLALSMLYDDDELQSKMNQKQKDCLATAQSCTASVQESCHDLRNSGNGGSGNSSISTHLNKHQKKLKKRSSNDTATTATTMKTTLEEELEQDEHEEQENHISAPLLQDSEEDSAPSKEDEEEAAESSERRSSDGSTVNSTPSSSAGSVTSRGELDLTKMIQRLRAVLPTAASSLNVPVTISLDPKLQKQQQHQQAAAVPTVPEEGDDFGGSSEAETVPARALATEADIFRAAVCLMTNACTRAASGGSTEGVVRLHIRMTTTSDPQCEYLILESTDTGAEPTRYEYDQMQDIKQSQQQEEEDVRGSNIKNKLVVQPFADLQEVACHIRSIGGRGGIRSTSSSSPRADDTSSITHSFFFEIPFRRGLTTNNKRLLAEEQQRRRQPSSPRRQGRSTPAVLPSCAGIGRASVCPSFRRSITCPEGPAIGPQKGCRRALVIDDSGIIRKMLSNALTRLGYDQVIQACDGAEGVHCLQRNVAYEVVFCDFLMPVMDGMDCIRTYREWERKHRPGYHQYVVGISAHASADDVRRAKELGMDDYRDKPLKFPDIKKLIEQIADQQQQSNGESLLPLARPFLPPPPLVDDVHEEADGNSSEEESNAVAAAPPLAANNKQSCLVITSQQGIRARLKASCLALEEGIYTSFAENSQEGLDLLQSRNWTIVLVDDAVDDGLECIRKFRSWEKLNRVRRQHNVHLLMTTATAAGTGEGIRRREEEPTMRNDLETVVQLPTGVDNALWGPFNDQRLHPVLVGALQATWKGMESASNNQIRPQDFVTRG